MVPGWIFLAIVLSLIPHDMMYGPQAALIAECFTPRLRYSGASLGYQLASVIAGGPAPLIATALFAAYRSGYAIAVYILVCAVDQRDRGGAAAGLHQSRDFRGIRPRLIRPSEFAPHQCAAWLAGPPAAGNLLQATAPAASAPGETTTGAGNRPIRRGGKANDSTRHHGRRMSEDEHRRAFAPRVDRQHGRHPIEWYDFLVYGTVTGLVFGKLFFPHPAPLVGMLEAFASFSSALSGGRSGRRSSAITATASGARRP